MKTQKKDYYARLPC